jgi:RNA polymerase sigma factor for flagellar operon FliA
MQGAEFITQHQRMVHGLAVRLRRELNLRGELDDLIAFGFGGLLEARARFDPARGVRFKTFAYHRVRGAMLDGVRKMADLPRRTHERLVAEAQGSPTAAPTDLDKAFTRIGGSLTGATVLQGRFGTDSPEAVLLKNESVTRLLAALPTLSARQRVLIRGFYFEGRSIDAMSKELGISRSWASRLHTQALGQLRRALDPDQKSANQPKSGCSR